MQFHLIIVPYYTFNHLKGAMTMVNSTCGSALQSPRTPTAARYPSAPRFESASGCGPGQAAPVTSTAVTCHMSHGRVWLTERFLEGLSESGDHAVGAITFAFKVRPVTSRRSCCGVPIVQKTPRPPDSAVTSVTGRVRVSQGGICSSWTKVLAVRRGDVVENGESSRSTSEVDPSLNGHNIEIGSMFAACCKTGEIGSPLLVHFPESVLLIPRREQGTRLRQRDPSPFPVVQNPEAC
jgi:hypothetical protein